MKTIISGLLGAAAAVLLLPAAVSAAEQSDLRWGYTPDGCYYLENVHNDECDFTFEKGTDCRFSCEWGGGSSECLAEMGLKMPDTIRIDEISDLYVYYYAELCLDDCNWFGLHCKLQDDEKKGVSREIYTVEAWGTWRPGSGRQIASGYADGRRYDYYSTERFNQPTIEGTRDTEQFWCLREQNPVTLNVPNHLNEMIDLQVHLKNLLNAGAVRADEIPESVTLYLEN
ncbi:MAG: glycoside hydrolase family 11 protein, partial [Oscillospiraceae bacterium]|nr:glycoside hydrolase family 11 protein [Oscillospiraceae bacterium]